MSLSPITLEEFISRCFPGEVYPPPQKGVIISEEDLGTLFRCLSILADASKGQANSYDLAMVSQDLSDLEISIRKNTAYPYF